MAFVAIGRLTAEEKDFAARAGFDDAYGRSRRSSEHFTHHRFKGRVP
jgi:hypothetical protein